MIYSDKIKLLDEFVDPCICNAWVAAAIVGTGLISAGANYFSAGKAADVQKENAQRVADMQQQQYQQTRADLSPYRDIGADASSQLRTRLSDLTSPIAVDPDELQNSDYFKFAMNQGQKAVTNSAAKRGLATSGAALKGAAAFAKGLATDTYKTEFDMRNINQTNAYNRLKALVDTGAGAATGTGVLGEKAAYNAGTALTGGANAEAAAINKQGQAISGLADNLGGYAMYQGLYGSKGNILPGNSSTGHVPFSA